MAGPLLDSSKPLTMFPLFPHLPMELRLQIWQHTLPTTRILKISYSPTHSTYISNTAPPIGLSINRESRSQTLLTYTHLLLGPHKPPLPTIQNRSTPPSNPYSHNLASAPPPSPIPLIPIAFASTTLYISSLAPILQTHLHDLLYNLSTSPHRHHITHLAFDLRVWMTLCEHGLLGILAKMRALEEVDMVVEFGRSFRGEVGFLEAPEWRGDLRWVADRAGREVGEEKERGGRVVKREKTGGDEGKDEEDERRSVKVKCVILTRGGEQA